MGERITRLLAPVLIGLLATPCFSQDPRQSCATCHQDVATIISGSVHARFKCQDCHGGPEEYALPPGMVRQYLSAPKEVGQSNGELSFDHGDGFLGTPARSAIPDMCGSCHNDVKLMNPYGLRTDQLARYWTSGHGVALKQNQDDRVAICIDCHGNHGILPGRDPKSLTHPKNVPAVCATCHGDAALMGEYDLPVEIVEEYRRSVHGELLSQGDLGAPTCVTCHGNHSAMPPGVTSVGAVCGQCHQHTADEFSSSVHSTLPEFNGCVRCHGGGEGRDSHLVERITSPTGVLIERFEDLLRGVGSPSDDAVTAAIHPNPRMIMNQTLPTCLDCHEDIEDDESLPKLFDLLSRIENAERRFVSTGARLNKIGRGVLLVDNQLFKFEDAKTTLLELAPIQHALDVAKIDAKVEELNAICTQIDGELDDLERGLRQRRMAVLPVWIFALAFAGLWYMKYRQLHAAYVSR